MVLQPGRQPFSKNSSFQVLYDVKGQMRMGHALQDKKGKLCNVILICASYDHNSENQGTTVFWKLQQLSKIIIKPLTCTNTAIRSASVGWYKEYKHTHTFSTSCVLQNTNMQ
jgi:hypothetical protein